MNVPGRVYLVGGAVRDELLGRSGGDRDWVVVGATPEAMLEAGFTQVGRDFPVFLHPTSHEEYALARTERKTGQGHLGFECHAGPEVTLEEDLSRRDLTINAIAREPGGGLVDPFGGQQDLALHQLRHVSSAFSEDPLRIMRVARFTAQLGFDVAPATQQLMRAMAAAGALAELPAERVWQEFVKALSYSSAVGFIDLLRHIDALAPWFSECADLATDFQFVGNTPLQRYGSLGAALDNSARAALGKRLIAPSRYVAMAEAAGSYGEVLCRWHDADAAVLLDVLRSQGVLQNTADTRQQDFAELLALLNALHPTHTQIGDGAPLRELATSLAAIGAAAVADQNLNGPEIGAAIAQKRRAAIKVAQRSAGDHSAKR